tara:strand:+ start:1497 stop:1730 length:234 start_codon:yes stop_codon:yes gene_type:complete
MITSIVYAEPVTNIQIEEWDDVYIITNGDQTFRIDCVPDEDTTEDIKGFCSVMWSTYFYGPDCDQECTTDTYMSGVM